MKNIAKEYIRLNNIHNIELVAKGAYSSNGTVRFKSLAENGSSNISISGELSIDTITIDTMLAGGEATYIKMDIEGSEMEALLGAKNTIEKYRPNMAICLYHKESDLWEIPYYILKTYPDYKLYIRHYSFTTNETVLYAIRK